MVLARSGRVGENFHKPFDIEPYLEVQSKLTEELIAIDTWKAFVVYRGLKENLARSLT
jgi:hypothetical protein